VPLQWKALRSGRNVSDVMRRRLAAAVTDSERVVFTSLLIELGAIRDSASRVAELLDATDRVDAFRGYAQLQRLEQESTPAQSDSTGQAVLQRIVSGVLDRVGRQRRDVDSTQRGQGLPPMRYAVSIDGLTLAMRRQLADAGVEMVPARFREGEHDAIDRVTVTVRQRGLLYFVSETYGSRSFYARSGYWMTTDSGESYILVSTPSGFRVIKRQSWIA
jgi:hypothetical protein